MSSIYFWLLVTVIVMFPTQTLFPQHFREHLNKLFAQGIGMLDIALTEAFSLLSDVSNTLMLDDSDTRTHTYSHRKDTLTCTKKNVSA